MTNQVTILFDLDGTLTDPKTGIISSILFALEKMNIKEEHPQELESFIGPPLRQNFKERYHLSDSDADQVVAFYREYFSKKGLFENKLYPQVKETLEEFKNKGTTLFVATSKPTVYAIPIIKYFEIDQYFEEVVGSNLDNTRTDKTEIIGYLVNKYNLDSKSTFMIGDREFDIVGAKNNNITSVAVTYGYGSTAELTKNNPDFIIKKFSELIKIIY